MTDLDPIRPLLICGPSGSGKSTLIKKMLQEFPDKFAFSVSHTTRERRPGEEDGKHYHFTDEESIKREIQNGHFIEHVIFGGNYYGTSKAAVEKITKQGKVCVLDIEMEGMQQVKYLNPWSIFIKPPSLQSLKERLINRNTETKDSLNKRLDRAKQEIEYGMTPGNFDTVIVNDDLNQAYSELKEFVVEKVLQNNTVS